MWDSLGHYSRALWRYAPRRILKGLGLMTLGSFTEGIGLLMLVPLLQLLNPGEGTAAMVQSSNPLAGLYHRLHLPLNLTTLLAAFLVLVGLRALLVRAREIQLSQLQLGFVDSLRKRIYAAISNADWLFLSRRRNTDFSHVLTTDVVRIGYGTQSFLQLLVTALTILAHLLVALYLSPAMTAIALLTGVILLTLLWPLVGRARQLGTRLTQANQTLHANVGDFLQGIKLAKSYSAEARHTAAFDQTVDATRAHMVEFTRARADSHLVFQIGAALALSMQLVVAARFMGLPGPELLVLVLVFARLLPMLSSLQREWQYLAFMLPAYESARQVISDCLQAAETPASGTPTNLALHREIRLQGVHFHYGDTADREVLAGIDLVIPAFETTALTGPSGAGKSTLADLLMGLLTPTRGHISIDGLRLTSNRLRGWRKQLAYVPQETFLFHDSLRANLLWARPEASDEECWRVLELAAAKGFVAKLPDGLDTVLGERGIRLSGGERQRIALARALLRRPALLLLDEATSALDQNNEQRIQRALDTLHGELTIVVIAHRQSSLEHADRIVHIDKGRLQTVHCCSNQRMNRPIINPRESSDS